MGNNTDANGEDAAESHDACPGSWCVTIACAECGEMLTNPRPMGDDGYGGVCLAHGRKAPGVLMHRADCLVVFGSSARGVKRRAGGGGSE